MNTHEQVITDEAQAVLGPVPLSQSSSRAVEEDLSYQTKLGCTAVDPPFSHHST